MSEPKIEEMKCWLITGLHGLKTYKILHEGEKAYWAGDPSVGIFGADVRILNVFLTRYGTASVEIEFEDGEIDEVPIDMIQSQEDMLKERMMDLDMERSYWKEKYENCQREREEER